MKKIEEKVIVVIEAVDWAMYHDQVDSDTKFDVIRGIITGFLAQETDDYIAVTQQQFTSGQIRQTISIPRVCIVDETRYTYNFEYESDAD